MNLYLLSVKINHNLELFKIALIIIKKLFLVVKLKIYLLILIIIFNKLYLMTLLGKG